MTPINTMELARRIWDQSPHNWNDFCQMLQSHPDRFSHLDEDQIQQLEQLGQQMETEGEQFPQSVERLHHLLAERLASRSSAFIP